MTTENTKTSFSFENLQTELNKTGYNTYILPVNADNAVEQILVSTLENTTEKAKDGSPVIQIMFVNDLLATSNSANDTFILQFFVSLPFKTDKNKISEMQQLLSVFSRILPVGAFGLSDEEGAFFRYSLVSLERNIESRLIVELVKMISFFINKFSMQINYLAQNQKSLEDILKETEKEFIQVG